MATEPDTPRSPLDVQDELSRRTGKRIRLVLTNNKSSMITARRKDGGILEVRMQRMFMHAPDDVFDDVVDVLRGRDTGKAALRQFVDRSVRGMPSRADRRSLSRDRLVSRHHDIGKYARELNEIYLGNRSIAGVIWGVSRRTRSVRSIRFGSYDPIRNLITMNRKLDRPDIPRYFVEFVLFHEMLHEVLGIGERADGKREIHGRLFKLMESTYPDFEKALRYEKELCKRLDLL